MNDIRNEIIRESGADKTPLFSSIITEYINDKDANETYQVISTGFEDTNINSILRQNMTRDEFEIERKNPNVKKILLTEAHGDIKKIIGYASIIVGQENIPWIDADSVLNDQNLSINTVLCTIGAVVILPEYRNYENIEELLKKLGSYLGSLNIETVSQNKDFGVVFDCAPTNTSLPPLVDHLLNKHLGPTEVNKIGYTTSLFVSDSYNVDSSTSDNTNLEYSVTTENIFSSHFLEKHGIKFTEIAIINLTTPIKVENLDNLIKKVRLDTTTKSILIKLPFSNKSFFVDNKTLKNIDIEEQSIWISRRKL